MYNSTYIITINSENPTVKKYKAYKLLKQLLFV